MPELSNYVYKVHILDSTGLPVKIIVYQGQSTSSEIPIFSKNEQLQIDTTNPDIIYSKQLLHKDDSIRTIKQKILFELDNLYVSYDELYIFAKKLEEFDILNTYINVTDNDKTVFTKLQLAHVLMNIHCTNPDIIKYFEEHDKHSYSYNDLVDAFSTNNELYEHSMPIGQRFASYVDMLYSANPFNILPKSNDVFKFNQQNALITFENSLLLNYGNVIDNILYVTTTESVLTYGTQYSLENQFMIALYFPALLHKNIHNLEELTNSKTQLLADTKPLITQEFRNKTEIIDKFYDVYYQRKNDLPYIERGIRSFALTLHPTHTISLPLDNIFKLFHTTPQIPYIKYVFGGRREPLYRLYVNGRTKQGKKIPALSRIQINSYSKQSNKSKHITIAIHNNNNVIFMDFMHNGNIGVNCSLIKPISNKEFESLLFDIANPVIKRVNQIIEKSGYIIKEFKNVVDTLIEYNDMHYECSININNKAKPIALTSILSNVFNILQDDISKGAILQFKRVDNYTEMSAMHALITQVYKQTNSRSDVVNSLVINFQLNEDDAQDAFVSYLNEHILINGQYINKSIDIVANPGFPCIIYSSGFDNKLSIEITGITSIHYIELLHIYIDSYIRITQFNNSINFNITPADFRPSNINHEIDKVSNVILPAMTDIQSIYIKPLDVNNSTEPNNDDENDDGILFSDDDDDDGILFSDDDEDDEDDDYNSKPEGKSGDINNDYDNDSDDSDDNFLGGGSNKIKTFSSKLMQLEPALFRKHKEGLYKSYARLCPNQSSRQPVILTDAEKARIDEEYPGSYDAAMRYGTDPKNKNWYLCPRYWCLKNNRPMTQAQVDNGDCGDTPGNGKVIPQTGNVPKGSYIYEFTDNIQHKDVDGKYRQHRPGFLPDKSHPDYCLPCCFKQHDTEQQIKRRTKCGIKSDDYLYVPNSDNADKTTNVETPAGLEPTDTVTNLVELDTTPSIATNVKRDSIQANQRIPSNVFGIDKFPIILNRWGFLPLSIELFLHTDNSTSISKKNAALIETNEHPLLRHGVEQSINQSFIGCIADLYAHHKNIPHVSIVEMRHIIIKNITIDIYVNLHNGVLLTTFQPKRKTYMNDVHIEYYKDSNLYKSITDFDNGAQMRFIYDTVASYENFMNYLKDNDSYIDHTYLWDIVCSPESTIFTNGLNLVIMEIMENDITDNVELICPTNSYSDKLYDSTKDTVLIIKHNEFYEPVYVHDKKPNNVIKMFNNKNVTKGLMNVLNMIMQTTNKYCKPLPSIPSLYEYKQNNSAKITYTILRNYKYKVDKQVVNFRGKIVGYTIFELPEDKHNIFIPVLPSTVDKNIKQIFIDDVKWTDYQITRDSLLRINNKTKGEIKCKPLLKYVEDGLIVGIITETNQYISVSDFHENNIEDGIESHNVFSYKNNGYIEADKTFATSIDVDTTRTTVIQNISFETQFYIAFRNVLRNALNDYYNKNIRDEIEDIIYNKSYVYSNKLIKLEQLLRQILNESVSFDNFDNSVLQDIASIKSIQSVVSNNMCLNQNGILCIPSKNLVNGHNNDKLYFSRVADELLRYTRIRLFMLDNKQYLNISNTNYNINDNEIILINSLLQGYFTDITPIEPNEYIKNNSYNMTNPSSSGQSYSHKISLHQQYELSTDTTNINLFTKECVIKKSGVIHSNNDLWNNMFPEDYHEYILDSTVMCSYYVIIHIFNEIHNAQINILYIKNALIEAYKPHLIKNKSIVYDILNNQGKHQFTNAIQLNKITFESMIMNEDYTLTNLDLWVLAMHLDLHIMLFNPNKFNDFGQNLTQLDWLVLNGDPEVDTFYYIRHVNDEQKYNIITPSAHFRDLLGFEIVNSPNYLKNIQSLTDYMSTYIHTRKIKRRRKKIDN